MYGFHYGLGTGWGPNYTFLRRWTNLSPVSAGLLSGAAMSVVVGAYPLVVHLRGFATHLVFGLGVAATVEALYWLGRNGGDRG